MSPCFARMPSTIGLQGDGGQPCHAHHPSHNSETWPAQISCVWRLAAPLPEIPFEHHKRAIGRLQREAHGLRIGRVGIAGLGDLQRQKLHKHHALGVTRLDEQRRLFRRVGSCLVFFADRLPKPGVFGLRFLIRNLGSDDEPVSLHAVALPCRLRSYTMNAPPLTCNKCPVTNLPMCDAR